MYWRVALLVLLTTGVPQAILSAAKLNNSPTICDEPGAPVPSGVPGLFV